MTDVGVGLWAMQSSATRPAPYSALYRDFVEAAVLADELDFHAVWLAEHRLWYDGYCPALLHAEAAAASRTSTIRLGQAMIMYTNANRGWFPFSAGLGEVDPVSGAGYRFEDWIWWQKKRDVKESRIATGKGFESVVLFALDQFCLIGYAAPLPSALRRSVRMGS